MNKLVIIDDDLIFHKMVNLMIQRYHSIQSVTYTADPLIVLEFLEEHKDDVQALPEAILLDLYMPSFSGRDFLERFNNIYKMLKRLVKVYIVSFSIHPKDMEISKLYPFVEFYFVKPLTPQNISLIEQTVSC